MKSLQDEARRAEFAPLLASIFKDSQTLIRQEVQLAQCELRQEARQAAGVSVAFAGGLAVASLAGLMLIFGGVHLLCWAVPAIPLWASYLLFGLTLAVLGAGLLAKARAAAQDLQLLPTQTIQSVKENAQWIAQSL